MSTPSIPEALRDHPDLIGPFTFPDKLRGFCTKYYISLISPNFVIGWIAFPLITGLGLVLFGKASAVVLIGKALLATASLACAHQIHKFYQRYSQLYDSKTGWFIHDKNGKRKCPEIHEAIRLSSNGFGYAWLKWVLATATASELTELNQNNSSPLTYANEWRNNIAVAMVQEALRKNPGSPVAKTKQDS